LAIKENIKVSEELLPSYTLTQPSTGAKISYRPFTVKEEKALLLALQDDSIDTIINAIKKIVNICTGLDANKIPYYDLEYIFLKIRSKSIGEIVELIGKCDCEETPVKTEFHVNIDDVIIEPAPTKDMGMIPITDTKYFVKMHHPSLDDFIALGEGKDADEIVVDCIESVLTEDDILDKNRAEKLEFIQSISRRQRKGIEEFIAKMPAVKLNASYTCRKCGKQHESVLSGYENFFL
jgi:hypothetical protein